MRILIIHHLQPMWSEGLRQFHGVTSEQVMRRMVKFLRKNPYDRVILTQYEHWEPSTEHVETGLDRHVNHWEEYGYGWTRTCLLAEPHRFAEGGTHSEAVYLAQWMRDLKGHSVSICGAFDGECIDDLETALNHLEIEFSRLEEFIY